MKIVNENIMFILKSIRMDEKETDSILLELGTIESVFIPRDFDEENYIKVFLNIVGCKDQNNVLKKIKEFEGDFIDFKILENGNLDIWSEEVQVVELELKELKEFTKEYSKEDWINKYESLCYSYHKANDLNVKYKVATRKFENKLQFFLEEELRRIDIKNQVVEMSKYEKRKELAKQILNFLEQYKLEKKEI